MRQPLSSSDIDRRLPQGDEIFLDHVGHFVRDSESASRALASAGFAPTPVSVQADAAGQPTGTGNVTAMFQRGYVEMLFKTADTQIGREFEAAIAQHAGVHLAAFSVVDAERAHARLAAAGFKMRPLVNFSRPVGTESGTGVAAFTVVRVERGEMAEGRVQILAHRTEDMVWQRRWLAHPNGALGLVDLVIAVDDVAEAAARFARFTDRKFVPSRFGQAVALDRGRVQLMTAQRLAELLPEVAIPGLPFMGAYGVAVASLANAEASLRRAGLAARRIGQSLAVKFPEALGVGAWLFVESSAGLPWRG